MNGLVVKFCCGFRTRVECTCNYDAVTMRQSNAKTLKTLLGLRMQEFKHGMRGGSSFKNVSLLVLVALDVSRAAVDIILWPLLDYCVEIRKRKTKQRQKASGGREAN